MYLRGSKWSYTRRRRRSNPWRVILLLILVGAALYVNQVVVPATPPLFVPTPTPTRSPESYVTEAENLVTQGKIPQAIAAYQEAVKVDPRNPLNYVALARLLIYSGDYQNAIINAENALLISPNQSMAYALRGWAKGFLGDYMEAIASLNRAIELDPNNAIAYAYLAETIVQQIQVGEGSLGSLDQAVEASRTAQQLAPNLFETHRARGIVLEQTGNYEEAVRELEAAVAQNPNVADIHLALGRNYRFLQQYEKAVEEFNRANALNPNDPLPLINISRTYATVGEFAKAIQFAQQAIRVSPEDPYLYGNLGVMQYRNREYPAAVQSLRLAVRGGNNADGIEVKGLPLDYGRIAEYYFTYGLALARQGECGEALQISQLLIKGVSNDEISVYNANEIINICQEVAQTPRPAGTPTLEPMPTPTTAQ